MTIHILDKKQTQEIKNKLKNQFGISKLTGTLIKIGQERIFLYQGNLTEKQLLELANTIPIERVGIYFCKIENQEVRLSIDGAHLLKDQITKGTLELNEEQMKEFMSGNELFMEDFYKGKKEMPEGKYSKKIHEKDLLTNKTLAEKSGKADFEANNSEEKPSQTSGGGGDGVEKKKISISKGFIILTHKEDFLGTGKASENKITNFIPKNRRLKQKS